MIRYFTLQELCFSATAEDRGIDNFPTWEVANNLRDLTERILDPLRQAWGGPINVSSGYRCPLLNTAVGGSPSSVHPLGWAADLQPANGKTEYFIDFARSWVKASGVRFDQFIRETDGRLVWLHISLYSPVGSQRGQFLDLVKK